MAKMAARLKAIQRELERASLDYMKAKDAFDDAQVRFEIARDRITATKRLASDIMTWADWWDWRREHSEIRYAGTAIGEAIGDVLIDQAFEAAYPTLDDPSIPFNPSMNLEAITDALESGGFDFRSAAPRREVNAALINLEGVQKSPEDTYATTQAQEIFDYCKAREEKEVAEGQ